MKVVDLSLSSLQPKELC